MKVKELIEELKKFNPDGVVYVTTVSGFTKLIHSDFQDCKVIGVEDHGCALLNPEIIART